MARWVRDEVLNQPADFVDFLMNDYLMKNGFKQTERKGEQVWKEGDGYFAMARFLKYSYINGVLHLEAWVGLFREFAENFGINVDMNELFGKLYNKALEGDKDCGGLLAYNYFSGEPVTGANEGRPLFVRKPDAHFNLANFMRTHLYAALATLKIGLDILLKEEKVKVDRIYGHGGLFKTKGVGQGILAAAMDAPVAVMETAGEGGPWGMALLASYMLQKADGESLEQYLSEKVFGGESGSVMEPDPADVAGFDAYIKAYKAALAAEKAAVEAMPL